MPMLQLSGLRAGYGGIEALRGIDIHVDDGEIVTLIGNNGAGKSTTVRAISGIIRPRAGEITFEGRPLTRMRPHEIVSLGISHVPEGRGIFSRLSVAENLALGAYQRGGIRWPWRRANDDLSGRPAASISDDLARVFTLFPRLKERERQAAGTLSGGEQQMLAVGRAMMARPRLLLLDEPSMGLSPILVQTIFATIAEIRKQGVTILLVEQNASMALKVADRGYVLESGEVMLSGPGAELARDEAVRRAYLGEE